MLCVGAGCGGAAIGFGTLGAAKNCAVGAAGGAPCIGGATGFGVALTGTPGVGAGVGGGGGNGLAGIKSSQTTLLLLVVSRTVSAAR